MTAACFPIQGPGTGPNFVHFMHEPTNVTGLILTCLVDNKAGMSCSETLGHGVPSQSNGSGMAAVEKFAFRELSWLEVEETMSVTLDDMQLLFPMPPPRQ